MSRMAHCVVCAQPGPELEHAPMTGRNPRGLRRLIHKASKDSPGTEAAADTAVGAVSYAEQLHAHPS